METIKVLSFAILVVFGSVRAETPVDGITAPSPIHLKEKDDLVLSCNATDDTLNFTWWRRDQDKEEPIGATDRILLGPHSLTIKKPVINDTGEYVCKMFNNENLFKKILVILEPQVTFLPKGKSRTVVQGETLELDCYYTGSPKPDIKWFVKVGDDFRDVNLTDRVKLLPEEGKRSGVKNSEDYAFMSTLQIGNTDEADSGEYQCRVLFVNRTAENVEKTGTPSPDEIIEKSAVILVRVKDKLAALWPFLGIVAEVAVLCTIIFIYEKRRSKHELEESDTDQSPETKNASGSKDKDVRQRK